MPRRPAPEITAASIGANMESDSSAVYTMPFPRRYIRPAAICSAHAIKNAHSRYGVSAHCFLSFIIILPFVKRFHGACLIRSRRR